MQWVANLRITWKAIHVYGRRKTCTNGDGGMRQCNCVKKISYKNTENKGLRSKREKKKKAWMAFAHPLSSSGPLTDVSWIVCLTERYFN